MKKPHVICLVAHPAAGNPFVIHSNPFIELLLRALHCSKWTFRLEGVGIVQDRAWCWLPPGFGLVSPAKGPVTLVTAGVGQAPLQRWSELPAGD